MSEPAKLYGWSADDWDNEHFSAPHWSIDEAFDAAQDAIDSSPRHLDPGRTVEVWVREAKPAKTFDAYRLVEIVIDDFDTDHPESDDPERDLKLHTEEKRLALAADLRAAWERHVERENVRPYYVSGRKVESRTIVVGGEA